MSEMTLFEAMTIVLDEALASYRGDHDKFPMTPEYHEELDKATDIVDAFRKQMGKDDTPVVYTSASGGVTQFNEMVRGDAVILNIDWDETDPDETDDPEAARKYIDTKLEEFEPYADIYAIAEAVKELHDARLRAFEAGAIDPEA